MPINKTDPCGWTDDDIEKEIKSLCVEIKDLLTTHQMWYDCGFQSQLERSKCEPCDLEPVILNFHAEGMMTILDSELEIDLRNLLDNLGYWYETQDSVTISIRAQNPQIAARYYEYMHWKWVCSLLTEDTSDVYEEIYSRFERHPEDLYKLGWREFEILLFRIFQNQGYKAVLGAGQNDGGVDIKLWQENPIGDVLTLVQAKKYRLKNKIGLEPVAALYGITKSEKASGAIFVTTSSYAPVAKRFENRNSKELYLAEKDHVIDWCSKASRGVIADKSSLISIESLSKIVYELCHAPDARILHSTWGWNMIHNSYAIVVKETKHAALIISIGSQKLSDDGYGQRGSEAPLINNSVLDRCNAEFVVRAQKSVDDRGKASYWDGRLYYTPWNKKPNDFDYVD